MKKYVFLNQIFRKFKKKETAPSRATVRRWALKKSAMSYVCSLCGNEGVWHNMAIPLELHHCNGNNKDNRLENLVWLCPNCHSQTVNWRRRKT